MVWAQAIFGDVPLALLGIFVVVVMFTARSSVCIVEEGEKEALLIFGEMETVLEPGLNILPPFVSETHPINEDTMTVETGGGGFDVPEEFREDLRSN